ncbi:MAG: sulfurtransferase-like selenium metabolism protein YedF [candidate division Zixibacteria bacterium]|nr:sulfurtransferase-like selenium metabolism protein YedF [candidate division Zixibacteria bacterium]
MTIDKDLLMIFESSGLGEGEIDLGEKLMSSFLDTLSASDSLPVRILCVNSGVFLSTEGSFVEKSMKALESHGVEILSCLTCLKYYEREDQLIVGKPTNMKETVDAMLSYKRVLRP